MVAEVVEASTPRPEPGRKGRELLGQRQTSPFVVILNPAVGPELILDSGIGAGRKNADLEAGTILNHLRLAERGKGDR